MYQEDYCNDVDRCVNGVRLAPKNNRPAVCAQCECGSPDNRYFPLLFQEKQVPVTLPEMVPPSHFANPDNVTELLKQAAEFGACASLLLKKQANENSLYNWMTRYSDPEAGSLHDDVAEDWGDLYVFAASMVHGGHRFALGDPVKEKHDNGVRMFSALSKWHKPDYWDVSSNTRAVDWLLVETGFIRRYQHYSADPILGNTLACNATLFQLAVSLGAQCDTSKFIY